MMFEIKVNAGTHRRMQNGQKTMTEACLPRQLELIIQEGHDGPAVAHLSLLDCDSKIGPSDLVLDPT